MNNSLTTPFVWQGRNDTEEVGDSTRWHHRVRPFDSASTSGVALIGFGVDEGVRRNGGRPGAAQGPMALRGALVNMPVLGEPALWDAGDIASHDKCTLEEAQEILACRVAEVMAQGCWPLVMGGGHEVAWGTFQGIARARPELQRLLIVNLDAHFDLRMAERGNSGTPFRQIADWCRAHGRPFDYHVLGISRFANTQALFDRAQSLGVRHRLDEQLQSADQLALAQAALADELARCDGVYLTVCLDVLPGSLAPGVSAPTTLGLSLACVEAIVDQVMSSGRVLAADLAELNPLLDEGGRTARVAARLAARIARSAQRPGED
jgi:formiminoglutamase